jgi:hypothetical protein
MTRRLLAAKWPIHVEPQFIALLRHIEAHLAFTSCTFSADRARMVL